MLLFSAHTFGWSIETTPAGEKEVQLHEILKHTVPKVKFLSSEEVCGAPQIACFHGRKYSDWFQTCRNRLWETPIKQFVWKRSVLLTRLLLFSSVGIVDILRVVFWVLFSTFCQFLFSYLYMFLCPSIKLQESCVKDVFLLLLKQNFR